MRVRRFVAKIRGMQDRRSWLKAFGVGALVAPIVDGMPNLSLPAQLVTTPEIKAVEVVKQIDIDGIISGDHCDIMVILRDRRTRTVYRFHGETFVVECKPDFIDVSRSTSLFRKRIIGRQDVEWTLKGLMLENVKYMEQKP